MMFINSIFLPKTISDQTVPEGSFGKIGNFSHLFSNVFRIVHDDQESPLPFQPASLNSESAQNTPNELLNISLFSDNQSSLENTNISMIVSAFILKLSPGENDGELSDINKVKINEKIPKYFSLSKNEFITEIKNIIETLKSGDPKSLENVEISLIASGQSIKINPLTTDIVELENWANQQIQSNSDFEILVKSGLQKLSVDFVPVKMESSKTLKPLEIISISTYDDIETGTKYIVDKNSADITPVLKNSAGLESVSKQPLEDFKQTITPAGDQTVKQEISTVQKQGDPPLMVDSKIIFEKNIVNDESVIIKSEVQDKVVQNIPAVKNDLAKGLIPGTKNELLSNAGASHKKKNVLTDSKGLSQKNVIGEKQVESLIKNISSELKVKPNVLRSGETLNNIEMNKKTSEVNVKEINNFDMKIAVKSNQKISFVTINKNTGQEKIALTDLMKKTDVKEIDINVQKFIKTNSINSSKIQNENHSDAISIKHNTTKIPVPTSNAEVKKDILINQEAKQPIIKKSLETENVKTEKTFSIIVEEKPKITRYELNTKFTEAVKAQNTLKIKGQQDLFVEEKLVDNEKSAWTKTEKSDWSKIESMKASLNNQQTAKVNSGNEPVAKSLVEKKELEQIKTSQADSLKPKLEINESGISGKRITPEIKTEQKLVGFKYTTMITEDEAVNVQNNKTVKEVIKENVRESYKEAIAIKTKTESINSETEETEPSSSNNSKIVSKNLTERSVVENLRTSLKENINGEIKTGSVSKTQFENKSVKVDLMQRRVYSQIPPLEVIAEETEIKNLKNSEQNIDANKNIRTLDESIKSSSFATESKTVNEKQVWVKVSLKKHDIENVSEVKKQAPQLSKITIDTNSDSLKKDSDQNNYSEKESNETKIFKTQNVSADNTINKEQKPILQNQSTNNQQELVSNIKPELKTEHNPFKSALHSEETRFSSRAVEVVEKIKVISSGELVREVYKVFESGEKQSIVLRLVPKELGSIKIMLDTIDNVLTAKVEVENESVGHIIRNNVDQLKHSLLQSGVNVNSINISYHNPDQKQSGFQNHKRKNPSYQPGNDFEEVDESILSKKMGYNTYEYLA